ncbi:MAG: LysR substrate-binding domain-containing protein [Rhizobium sp.]|nr:LysR substrate-binding domain-containing protein [Rhizobium sp.]
MPFRPSHRQLDYLVTLGETGHFGEAARRCNVSQPTLSVQVALLEKQLGVTLIDRMPGQVVPTPIGAEIITAAKVILNGLDEIRALATGSKANLGGAIRLGVAPSFGPYFLPYLLPPLHQAVSGTQDLYPRGQAAPVGEGRACRARRIVGSDRCLPTKKAWWRYRFAASASFSGVPKAHPLAAYDTVPTEMLKGEKLLTLGSGHRLMDEVRRLADMSGATLAEEYEGSSLDAIRQMVSIEMGLSLFPELYVRSEFGKEDGIKLLMIDGWQGVRDIGFFWRQSSARGNHFDALAGLGQDGG